MKIKIAYEVDDGYCGPSAPQSVTVESSDFEYMTPAEIETALHAAIQEDFVMKLSPFPCESIDVSVNRILKALAQEAEQE